MRDLRVLERTAPHSALWSCGRAVPVVLSRRNHGKWHTPCGNGSPAGDRESMVLDTSGSRVYVADDVAANRTLLETILRRGGLSDIHMFADGGDLLDAIDVAEPDLILLDLRMPVVDGLEVLRRLDVRHADRAFLPIIVLTAESSPEPRRAALDLGATDYVTKPFDAGEVLLRVRNLLHTRALHRALQAKNVDLSDQVDVAREDLADLEREWADVARALADLETRDTSEETANAICNELKRISGLSSVMIVAIDSAGRAVPLAFDGDLDVRVGINRALPESLVEQWSQRVGRETWVGPWSPELGSVLRRVPGDQPTAMAIVPMTSSQGLLGGLVATTAIHDGIDYLTARLPVLTSFGAVASALLAPSILERQRHGATRAEIEAVLIDRTFHPVFQPVVELSTGHVIGYEALSRFDDGTRPDRRFADAAAVGLGIELEAATITAALGAAEALPDDRWVSLNVSPEFLLDPVRPHSVLARRGQRGLVLEITEHVAIEDYARFRAAVETLGSSVGFAVDDAGSGYASFRHILELRPDFVKLDIGLVHEIDSDDVRQALVAGIVYFAERTGCRLIAEGVETEAERARLQRLGVEYGQGYLLARPAEATTWAESTSATASKSTAPKAIGAAPARRR